MSAPIPPAPGAPDRPVGVATGYDEPVGFGGARRLRRGDGGVGPVHVRGRGGRGPLAPGRAIASPRAGSRRGGSGRRRTGSRHWSSDRSRSCATRRGGPRTIRCALPSPTGSSSSAPTRRSSSGRWRSGDLDLVFDDVPPPPVLQRYQDDPSLRPLIQTTTGTVFLSFASFNVAMPPFDDVAVRRAVAFAMDRAAIAEEIDPLLAHVAQHFASDTTEASLLASWSDDPRLGRPGRHGGRERGDGARRGTPRGAAAPTPSATACRS